MTGFRALLLAALLLLPAGEFSAAKADLSRGIEIWTGVLLATNEPVPNKPDAWLAQFAGRLEKLFGYNQFEILGRHAEKMAVSDGQWLIPTKQFYLEVETREGRGATYLLRFKLWHEKEMILQTEAHVGPASPLFVRGPQYGKGQLIFVVEVR